MPFIPYRVEPYKPPEESKQPQKEATKEKKPIEPEVVREHLREHKKLVREALTTGETPKTPEECEQETRRTKGVHFRIAEEQWLFAPRVIWWVFVGALVVNWVYEISVLTRWWGWAGTFIGFVIGIPLMPMFPILALVHGSFGVALLALILLSFLLMTLLYSWPEMVRFIRELRWRR